MFKKGDFVVSSANGICEITDVVTMNMSGSNKDYYLLIPLEEQTAKVYIPVDVAEKRIRNILSKEQAWEIIRSIPNIKECWVENEKERERFYKDALASREPERLIGIIKNMYNRRQARLDAGKKSTAVDERYFKLAENQLHAELAFAIGEEKKNIKSIIMEHFCG